MDFISLFCLRVSTRLLKSNIQKVAAIVLRLEREGIRKRMNRSYTARQGERWNQRLDELLRCWRDTKHPKEVLVMAVIIRIARTLPHF